MELSHYITILIKIPSIFFYLYILIFMNYNYIKYIVCNIQFLYTLIYNFLYFPHLIYLYNVYYG